MFLTLSARTGLVGAWNLKLSTSPSLYSSSKLPLAPLLCLSSLGRLSRLCVFEFLSKFAAFLIFSCPCSDTDCFQVRQVPVVHFRPPKRSTHPQNPLRRELEHSISSICLIDFVQDLYLKELKAYKPAPKVRFPRPTCDPRLFSTSELIQNLLFSSLGCE